jgi:surfactin synthase thioesterase subunit/glycosyltransferase involved in cell wall biosynthesis
MRILLTSNASNRLAAERTTRSNAVWLEYLAWRGHQCRVICSAASGGSEGVRSEAGSQGFVVDPDRERDDIVLPSGIVVSSIRDLVRRTGVLTAAIREFEPDWVFVSSEDIGHALLREADEATPGRIIYLAHTPQFLPFGPESWSPDVHAASRARRAAAVVVIGKHMAGYVERHLGVRPHVIPPAVYGPGPWDNFANLDSGDVLMVNPCAVKGVSLFAAVARAMPTVSFAALPGWGTTSDDRALLASLPNVKSLEPVRHIEEVLERTRILLMPSLWYEGFGLIVMEAMLRGIPVIASDSGGLIEAKHGTGYVLPVNPIVEYRAEFDEVRMPRPVIPTQDAGRWVDALRELAADRTAYELESERSREAALEFVHGIDPGAIEKMLVGLRPGMRILLAHNSLYFPSHGGGDKSNRLLMEALVACGNEVEVFARLETFSEEAEQSFVAELAARGTPTESGENGVIGFTRNGVRVFTSANNPKLRNLFADRIAAFDPDVILCSTDDPGALLLEVALRAPRARVVYLVRATVAVPFGPDCAFANPAKTEMIGRVDSIIGVSEYVADYVRRWGGFPAIHVPISLLEPGDYSAMGRFENRYVLMVNPCAVKGVSIFAALAEAMPDLEFAAVPTWGTNADDLALLHGHANITLFDPADDIAVFLRETKVVLVPSVWAEARSRMVVEAMIRGIPVIASDVGGLHEAKLGVPYLLPVNQIQRYHARVDANMVPVAEVPPQDIGPWKQALRELVSNRELYEEISRQSREAALVYAEKLNCKPLASHLEELIRKPKRENAAARIAEPLSDAKKKLLALRLNKSRVVRQGKWFTPEPRGDRPALYVFPHAGAGPAEYAWLKGAVGVRLPGRETRIGEPVFTEMKALIDALFEAFRPHANGRFAFFGHSMGAGIAFELARLLRREGLPLPERLIVSSARAPQLKTGSRGPEPSDAELLAACVVDPEVAPLVLPALRADTRLYRNYVYQPEAPLPLFIEVHGGADDASLTEEQLRAWGEQSTIGNSLTMHPGGHFFWADLAAGLNSDDVFGGSWVRRL